MKVNESALAERITSEQTIYEGRIISVRELTVSLPNGHKATREVVQHPGAVAILAETDDQKVLVVRQARIATGQILLEIPAGKLEKNEDPKLCAVRELEEETGYKAEKMRQIASFYTTPGFSDETVTLFYAQGLRPGEARPDDDEFLALEAVSRRQVQEMLEAQTVHDAKSILAFLWWLSQPAIRQ